jgi:hypothetical protein
MGDRLRLAGRAAAQVVLVSANSVTLGALDGTAADAYRLAAAGLLGFLISWLWWSNARSVAVDTVPGGRLWYAAGAMCGTVLGAALARWWAT